MSQWRQAAPEEQGTRLAEEIQFRKKAGADLPDPGGVVRLRSAGISVRIIAADRTWRKAMGRLTTSIASAAGSAETTSGGRRSGGLSPRPAETALAPDTWPFFFTVGGAVELDPSIRRPLYFVSQFTQL